ncbi:hypothetical protein POM88_037854 [Heracleum sosnowskyi]|uniref:Pentatricopeptide repeat-containing protein n=1 Tax=Heracleum sosnowskyi TaxID=360622 RepID=A0AAD8MG79_9APIA|nr:hypothetical protein POM88_037854 [Heracleum sosnowskyi]
MNYSASLAMVNADDHTMPVTDRRVDNFVVTQSDDLIRRRERKLFLMVGRVIKTLNMIAARQISFSGYSTIDTTSSSLLASVLIRVFALNSMLENAVDVFRQMMEKNGIEPSVVTDCIYISGLCRSGGPELALYYIRTVRCSNEPLSTYCFTPVIRSFCEKGKLDEAWRVLEEMKSCGVPPDLGS